MIVAKNGNKTLKQITAPAPLPERNANGKPILGNILFNRNYAGPRGKCYYEAAIKDHILYSGSNFSAACAALGMNGVQNFHPGVVHEKTA